MLIKRTPEDFQVRELTDFTPSAKGPVSVYELTKRKITTFQAVRKVAAAAKIPLDRIHYLALKDRQAVTTQLISVSDGRIPSDLRASGIKVRYLGRAPQHLDSSAALGNAFTIVVRDLSERDVKKTAGRMERTLAHGLINYFDDQRFGSLTAGQGMVGRDLVKGDYEAAVRRLLCAIGKRDPWPEKRFKTLVGKTWGDWDLIASKWGNRNGASMVRHLKRKPQDFQGALSRLPGKERAIHVFAYQSLIWNESVARYLTTLLPPHRRSSTAYVGGRHVWRELIGDQPAPDLPDMWPLLDHTVEVPDAAMRLAMDQALASEGLKQPRFEIKGIPGCFLKHYDRPLVIRPQNLALSEAEPDDLRPGRLRQTLSFELGSGSYATLVLKRVFGGTPDVERESSKGKKGKDKKGKGKKGKGKKGKRKKG